MSLLRQIQAEAASDAPISSLLRKCLILATRLNHNPLRNWANKELDGYEKTDNLPTYRIIRGVTSRGNLSGFGGREGQNIPLPHYHFPNNLREKFDQMLLRQGVSVLEHIVANVKSSHVKCEWNSEAIIEYGTRYLPPDWDLIEAWQEVPANCFVGVLDTIRNRMLNFALEIEKENPDAGESLPGTSPVPEKVLNYIFNNHFHGQVGNVAINSRDFNQEYK